MSYIEKHSLDHSHLFLMNFPQKEKEPRAVGNSSNRVGKSWAPHLQTKLKLRLRKAVCMCGGCAQGTEIMGPQLCGLTLFGRWT